MLKALRENPIARRAAEALRGFDVYFVGGFVRDALLGKSCLDIDLVLVPWGSDPGRELRDAIFTLAGAFGVKPKRSQFLTGKLVLEEGEIDIALARKEEYPEPGSLPIVRPARSLEEDLRRRDFTANAIAMSLGGELVDPLRGAEDVKARVLRVIHRGSFRDDPTRALRAIRYRHQLGFSYSEETEKEFALAKKFMARVSFERIKHELARSSARPERARIWLEMAERNLVGERMPEREALFALSERARLSPDSWVLFYALVSESIPAGLTRAERKLLSCIIRNARREFSGLAEAHEELRAAPEEALIALGALNPLLEDYRKRRPSSRPLTSAEEMKAMGFSGEKLGKAILALEKERIEERIKTPAEEREFLKNLF